MKRRALIATGMFVSVLVLAGCQQDAESARTCATRALDGR